MALDIRRLDGPDRATALPDVAALRMAVFREWPYLYEGTLSYEEAYLKPYLTEPKAVLIGAFDGDRLVGASTAMPLCAHADDFGAAFAGSDICVLEVFYCSESVLLPDYRGQGAGHAFFDLREAAARDLGYKTSAFCAVMRPQDHPARPAGYRPLDGFWKARGYRPLSGAIAQFSWPAVGDKRESIKPLQFWTRAL